MHTLIVLIAAILPPFLLFLYIWKKDPQKEPAPWLLKSFIGGIAICFPVAILELGIEFIMSHIIESISLIGSTVRAFIVAALPEETAKLFMLWLVLRKNPFFDEHFDGIVYAVCIGLGFAAIVNVFYVFSTDQWVIVAIARSLLAVPGHYAFAILMGYYYSLYHFVDHSRKMGVCVLLIPVLAHGFYDALAFSGSVNEYVGGIAFLVLIYFCIRMQKVGRTKVLALIEQDNESLLDKKQAT